MIKKLILLASLILGAFFSKQAPIDTSSLTGEYNPQDTQATFSGQEIRCPAETEVAYAQVLGDSNAEKRIEIDLTNQRLYAYEGDQQIFNFLVSTGKWGRTPTGTFWIWVKLRYSKMEGGSKALHTYYYLPNVPYVMYFFNDQIPRYRGFGIHGTYWHDNFGHPMSHGCINMKTEEVAQIYYWAQPNLEDKNSVFASTDNPGTKIVIYGQAP